jgi:hypothetical protein
MLSLMKQTKVKTSVGKISAFEHSISVHIKSFIKKSYQSSSIIGL